MKNVCVYCGSSPGADPVYRAAAQALGQAMARRGVGLVYGGASIGVMGAVADAVLAAGGRVLGVIPEALAQREVAHTGLTELVVTPSMHVRKMRMAEAADAFVALPGGIGTFEELFEIWTWAQLGIHSKPVALLNVAGYFDSLIALVDHAVAQGFLKPAQRALLWVDTDAERLLDRFAQARSLPPADPLRLDQG
ncbi:MAG: TIGR00730 family Rossman fold protein [Rhodoferax sp.]